MTLYIEGEGTVAFVDQRAKQRGITKQDAVRLAVQAELHRMNEAIPLRERLEAFWREHPMPPATGHQADKAFFHELAGGL
jgi:antitoxin VapB